VLENQSPHLFRRRKMRRGNSQWRP
jgi:hypothetical protein